MKIVKRILLIIFLAGFTILGYFYFGTYSEGVRSGIVIKVSKKGFLFKTYEGQLNLMTFGTSKSPNLVAENFDFSISSHEKEIIKILEEVSLSGERVSLHYKEKFVRFPWRGDTKYMIYKVERFHTP